MERSISVTVASALSTMSIACRRGGEDGIRVKREKAYKDGQCRADDRRRRKHSEGMKIRTMSEITWYEREKLQKLVADAGTGKVK